MKLQQVNNIVDSQGIVESGDFSIKTNPAAFQLLSSGLYSNKIRAVIRELSCNAVDAHAMNGMLAKPIEVKLPNELDTQFYVKDFGPGMSHDQIMRLYTTYFDSTKRDSNDFIGGFGVGSKSPFAYTDSFTVEARQDGKVRTYAAYVDDGFPKIAVLAEQDTDEPSGLTVRFPVKPGDFGRFDSEAMEVFKWFRQKPTILGSASQIPEIGYVALSPRIFIQDYSKTTYSTEAMVRMGDVTYPLTKFFAQLPDGDPDRDALDWIRQRRVLLEAPIGSISVAASREELAYDKPSMQAIRDMLTEGYRLALAEVIDRLKKLDNTDWEDRRAGYKLLFATGLSSVWTEKNIQENAAQRHPKPLPLLNRALAEAGLSPSLVMPFLYASPLFNWQSFKTFNVRHASHFKKVHQWDDFQSKINNHGRKMPEPNTDVVVFVDDIPVKSTWAVKAWKTWSMQHLHGKYGIVITPVPGMEDTPEFEAEKAALLKELGIKKEAPPLSAGLSDKDLATLRGRSAQSVEATTFFSQRATRLYENKSFYWVPDEERHQTGMTKDMALKKKTAFNQFVKLLLPNSYGGEKADAGIKAFLELMDVPTTRLYRIAAKDIETVKNMKGAKSAIDLCIENLQKPETLAAINAMDCVIDIVDTSTSSNPLAAVLYSAGWGSGERMKKATQGTQLGVLVEKLRASKIKEADSPQSKVLNLINALNDFAGNPVTIPQRVITVNSPTLFKKTYPMLKDFIRLAGDSDVDHMREYIKWCEEKVKEDDILPTVLGQFDK